MLLLGRFSERVRKLEESVVLPVGWDRLRETGRFSMKTSSAPIQSLKPGFLSLAHFGDHHITDETQQNFRDFVALIQAANQHFSGPNGAFLPGDNADNGTMEQFQLVHAALGKLFLPGSLHSRRSRHSRRRSRPVSSLAGAGFAEGCRAEWVQVDILELIGYRRHQGL